MSYTEQLRKAAADNNSILCLGMDPVKEKIPLQGETEDVIVRFYRGIIEAVTAESSSIGAVKPNYSFYAQYGFPGLRALEKVIQLCRGKKLPVILDAKRADIGKTSVASAKETFEFWKADAVTIAPYMGSDSVKPFIDFCSKGRGVYILVRTSNPGAADLQNLPVEGKPLYMQTAAKLLEWHREGTGAVVGATYPQELKDIAAFFSSSGKDVPLLIPGVGAQGGTAAEVMAALKAAGSDLGMHRVNSSSGINYAYEKYGGSDYAGAAVKAVAALNKEINF